MNVKVTETLYVTLKDLNGVNRDVQNLTDIIQVRASINNLSVDRAVKYEWFDTYKIIN